MVNPSRALEEMRRVLKSYGRLIFIEARTGSGSRRHCPPRRITPIWKHLAGGLGLDRPVDGMITATGFKITELKNFYTPGPRIMTYA